MAEKQFVNPFEEKEKQFVDPFKQEEEIVSPDDELLQSTPVKEKKFTDPFKENVGIGQNIYRTAIGALRDTAQGAINLTEFVESLNIPGIGLTSGGMISPIVAGIVKTEVDGYKFLTGKEYADKVSELKDSLNIEPIELPKIPEPTYTGGGFVRDATGFLIPFSILKVGNYTSKLGQAADIAARGVGAGQISFSPYEQRLSNLVEQYPKLQNPITNYLKADIDDSEGEARFKMAIEDIGLGALAETIIGLTKFTAKTTSNYINKKFPSLKAEEFKQGEPVIPKKQPSANKDLSLSQRIDEIAKPIEDVSVSTDQVRPGMLGGTYQKVATQAIDYTRNLFTGYDPLKSLPRKGKFLTLRGLATGKIGEIGDLSRKNFETFSKLDKVENLKVKKYLLGEGKLSSIKDPNIQTQAKQLREGIDNIGKKLEEAGILSKKVIDKNSGKYLPRLYTKYFNQNTKMGYTKTRKELDEATRKFLGEIDEVSVLGSKAIGDPMTDLARYAFFEQVAKDPTWTFKGGLIKFGKQDVSPVWLKEEADRIAREIDDGLRPKTDRSMVKSMNKLIDDAEMNISKADLKMYEKLPDTKGYGTLRGTYVRKEIFNDLTTAKQFADPDSGIAKKILGDEGLLTKGTQLWKLSKVALNPPTQMRNAISNIVLLNLSGIKWQDLPKRLIQSVDSIRKQDGYYQIAKKYGIINSTFSKQELIEIDKLYLKMKAAKGNYMDKIKYMSGSIADLGTRSYQAMEIWGKTAKIIDEMAKGADEATAALRSQKTLFDYSLVPSSVRYLRKAPLGMPFVTFYYKVLPNLLETAIRYPERYAPYVALPYAYHNILANYKGVTDEDFKKLTQTLPEYLRNRGNALAMPVKDNQGRWQFLDFSYFMPWASFTGLPDQLGDGSFQDVVRTTGMFGSPAVQLAAAVVTGIDPFTKREIVNKFDPFEKQIADTMLYLYRMTMPTWLTDIGFAGKLKEALDQDVNRYNDPKITTTQAIGRLFGANVYPIDPLQSRADNLRKMKNELSGLKARRTSVLKDPNLTEENRAKHNKKYNKMIQERLKQIQEYAKSSEVPEALLRD